MGRSKSCPETVSRRGAPWVAIIVGVVGSGSSGLSAVPTGRGQRPSGARRRPEHVLEPGCRDHHQPRPRRPSGAGVSLPVDDLVTGMSGTVSDIDVSLSGFSHAGRQRRRHPPGRPRWPERHPVLGSRRCHHGGGRQQRGCHVRRQRPLRRSAVLNHRRDGELPADRPGRGRDGCRLTFPAPAPSPSANTTLAGAFSGTTPNGTWSLFVVDDTDGDDGTMSGGWSLVVTTTATAAPTTTTLVSSPNPSTTGSSVAFTATVTSAGSPVTTGTLTFTDGPTGLATNVSLNASGRRHSRPAASMSAPTRSRPPTTGQPRCSPARAR